MLAFSRSQTFSPFITLVSKTCKLFVNIDEFYFFIDLFWTFPLFYFRKGVARRGSKNTNS